MKIADFFDRIFVLNLPARTDRKMATMREFERIQLPLTPGKVEFFPAIRPDHKAPFQRLGSKGCFLSTIQMLKLAQSENARNVLIMQDDITFPPYFKTNESAVLKKLAQTDWDIMQFGYMPEQEHPPQEPVSIKLEDFDGLLIGAHFFAVNGKSLARFIQFLESLLQRPLGDSLGGPMPIDGAINTFRAQNSDIVRLISIPVLGRQRSSRSDVTPKWFDKLAILHPLIDSLRSIKVTKGIKHIFK